MIMKRSKEPAKDWGTRDGLMVNIITRELVYNLILDSVRVIQLRIKDQYGQ